MSSTVSDHGTQLTDKTKLEEVGEVVLLSFVASCYRLGSGGRDSWQIRLCEAAGMEGAGSCSYFKEGWTAPSAVPTIPLMPQVDNLTPSLTIASLDDADGPRLQAHWPSSAGVLRRELLTIDGLRQGPSAGKISGRGGVGELETLTPHETLCADLAARFN
jgi:hypothetical protein